MTDILKIQAWLRGIKTDADLIQYQYAHFAHAELLLGEHWVEMKRVSDLLNDHKKEFIALVTLKLRDKEGISMTEANSRAEASEEVSEYRKKVSEAEYQEKLAKVHYNSASSFFEAKRSAESKEAKEFKTAVKT